MALMGWIFGRESAVRKAPIGERALDQADRHIENKVLRSWWNNPWFVAIRNYIIYPFVIRLPMLPIHNVWSERRRLALFGDIYRLLDGRGETLGVSHWPTQEELSRVGGNFIKKRIVWLFRGITRMLWRPLGKGAPDKSMLSSNPVRYASRLANARFIEEKMLSAKIFQATIVVWMFSIVTGLFVLASALWKVVAAGGLSGSVAAMKAIWADLVVLFSLDAPLLISGGQTGLGGLVLAGLGLWLFSGVLSFIFLSRPWVSMSKSTQEFLKGSFRSDEVDSRMDVLAFPYGIFLRSPSVTKAKLQGIQAGWPGGFMSGEIVENYEMPSEILIKRRPERVPITFGGQKYAMDIRSNLKEWDRDILSSLKSAVKKPGDCESFFFGEVIDPNFWDATRIFLEVKNNPHGAIVGQTRSGKTKSALSFIYSFKRAYPDTIFYFADGKSSPDYTPFAEMFSPMPVAYPDDSGNDPLIQFANIIETVWSEYMTRKKLFEQAKMDGKNCSTILEYRKLVGPMGRVLVLVDEFAVFRMELNFEGNYKTDGTLANRIKRLVAEAASYGIHCFFASQRYQDSDMPTVMRSNLTIQMIHSVNEKDADFLNLPEARTLKSGEAFLRAAGLFSEHTGLTRVKVKLPYIGDNPTELLKETCEIIDPALKRSFDMRLIYKKGDDDLDKIGVIDLSVRLRKFFEDLSYVCKELASDIEAVDVQFSIQKGTWTEETDESGITERVLRAREGAPLLGVSVLRGDEIDENSLRRIQESHGGSFPAILVYVAGKAVKPVQEKAVEKLNEKGTRFAILSSRDFYKDHKYIGMLRKEGREIEDLIERRVASLGISALGHADASKSLLVDEALGTNAPVKIKITKLFQLLHLEELTRDTNLTGLPCVQTTLPGGNHIIFLVAGNKDERDRAVTYAKRSAETSSSPDYTYVIVSKDGGGVAGGSKRGDAHNVHFMRPAEIDEYLRLADGRFEKDEPNAPKSVLDVLKRIRDHVGVYTQAKNAKDEFVRLYRIAPTSTVELTAAFLNDERSADVLVNCAKTHMRLYRVTVPIDRYTIESLNIPTTAGILVKAGAAPMGADPKKVKVTGRLAHAPSGYKVNPQTGLLEKDSEQAKKDADFMDLLKG